KALPERQCIELTHSLDAGIASGWRHKLNAAPPIRIEAAALSKHASAHAHHQRRDYERVQHCHPFSNRGWSCPPRHFCEARDLKRNRRPPIEGLAFLTSFHFRIGA